MTANPVLRGLIAARLQEANATEAAMRAFVLERLGRPPEDAQPPADFELWCRNKGLPVRPATPFAVANFIMDQRDVKLSKLLDSVLAVSSSHCAAGLSDPVPSWPVTEALLHLTKAEIPKSWPANERATFIMLPAALQKYLSLRERNREAKFRNIQNELADAKKALAAIEQKSSKETTNGTTNEATTETAA